MDDSFLVKKIRREKLTTDEIELPEELLQPQQSILGKRSHETTDDDQSEVEEEITVPEIFSRTL